MFKKIYWLVAALVFVAMISFLFIRSASDEQLEGAWGEAFRRNYRVFALPLPAELNFAGEVVPLADLDVRERYDRELMVNTYWQSQTLLFFKRANRWFPFIEPVLKEEGVPEDFKYLALIESGLMNVVSPAGAAGFWQIMETTGKELGLEVNRHVDERYHVEKATRAACKFLKDAYRLYGSWTLAAASYNMGRAGLSRQLNQQKVNNYYDLWLNDETSRYVFRILAIKAIFENPREMGFYFRPADLYPPFDYYTVKVDTTVSDLVAFALKHEITYKELRTLNPWIRQPELPNASRKNYEIKILQTRQYILHEDGSPFFGHDSLIMHPAELKHSDI